MQDGGRRVCLSVGAAWLLCAPALAQVPFEATWESLESWECPEWYLDAKLGVMVHWGPYAVPAFGSEWYPRNMYLEGSEEHKHHLETWGDPKTFGYKDFIPRLTGERFDPGAWAELFREAGAGYVVVVAEHHDGFAMYDSAGTAWDSAAMGPQRDVVGQLAGAVRERGLRFGVASHRAHHWDYYPIDEAFDTADPENAGLYGVAHEPGAPPDGAFLAEWLRRCRELVDGYRPDLFVFGFGIHAPAFEEQRRLLAAHYYTSARQWGRGVVINYKGEAFPERAAVLDIERGKLDGIRELPWQSDTSVCYRSWGYVENHDYKPAGSLVHDLADVVSKNGRLLLSVAPMADGAIPDQQQVMLREVGAWLAVCGEAVRETRPWLVFGEGPTGVAEPFDERAQKPYTPRDIRFTQAKDGSAVFAIVLGDPGETLVIHSLLAEGSQPGANVELLGSGPVAYRVDAKGRFVVTLPAEKPSRHAIALKLVGFDLAVNPAGAFVRQGVIRLNAPNATLEGGRIRLEQRPKVRTNIGYWTDPADRVHWLLRTQSPGTYAVRGRFAAGSGPTRLRLRGEGWAVEADIPQTEGWTEPLVVEFPSVELAGPGVQHVVLEAADGAAWRAANVWDIELARIDSP